MPILYALPAKRSPQNFADLRHVIHLREDIEFRDPHLAMRLERFDQLLPGDLEPLN
jgi:hypothetical protein